MPGKKAPLVERIRDCKSTLIGISNQLGPEADIEDIDAKLVQSFINKLKSTLLVVKCVSDESNFFKNKDGVYENVRLAKVSLTVALDARKDIDKNGFAKKVSKDYYESLHDCYKYINSAINNFKV